MRSPLSPRASARISAKRSRRRSLPLRPESSSEPSATSRFQATKPRKSPRFVRTTPESRQARPPSAGVARKSIWRMRRLSRSIAGPPRSQTRRPSSKSLASKRSRSNTPPPLSVTRTSSPRAAMRSIAPKGETNGRVTSLGLSRRARTTPKSSIGSLSSGRSEAGTWASQGLSSLMPLKESSQNASSPPPQRSRPSKVAPSTVVIRP